MDYNSRYMRVLIMAILLLGAEVFCRAQGDTLFNQTDTHNLKQGWWKKTYPNGKTMYKGFFKDDKPVGEMKRYYDNGACKAILLYDSAGEYAQARIFYTNGKLAGEGCYFNALKDSTWTYYSYYDHSLTSREVFTRGVRNGPMNHYYNNGNFSEKLAWVNDKKEGPWEQYYSNNILKLKGSYHNGKLEGAFLVNYETGKPYLKGAYKNDLRDGSWIFYREDGTVDMELEYRNGKTADEEKLDEKQQELFRTIDENQGTFEEPDETNFLEPAGR